MTAEQYRSLDRAALEQRRELVAGLLENPVEDGPSIETLRSETDLILAELERRNAAAQLREQAIDDIRSGMGEVRETHENRSQVDLNEPEDPFATDAYNRAFMRRIQTGAPIPEEYQLRNMPRFRADQFTTVATDAGDVVPTNLVDRIVQEEDVYGDILARVSKTSYPGGIAIPTADINPEAKWITEAQSSDDQKIAPDDPITFGYYGLEVKLAQSVLSQAITLSAFQDQFVLSASRAMVKAKEKGVLSGTGSTQMLGILNDTRVPAANKITMTEAQVQTWDGWSALKKAIKLAYRRGVLIMNKGTWDVYLDGMTDSSGQPVGRVTYGIGGEERLRFRGIDVLLVDDYLMADFDTAEATKPFAVFTDLSDYAINSALPLQTNRWRDFDENVVKLQMLEWLDGKLVDPFGTVIVSKASA